MGKLNIATSRLSLAKLVLCGAAPFKSSAVIVGAMLDPNVVRYETSPPTARAGVAALRAVFCLETLTV